MRYTRTLWMYCLFGLLVLPVLAQIPPILPTNERELKTTLDDISYSVNKITSPNFKVSPTFFERLLRTLETPNTPQPVGTQGNGTLGGMLGGIGRFVLGIVRWSVDLAKAIKQNKMAHSGGNGTVSQNLSLAPVNASSLSEEVAAMVSPTMKPT